MKQEQVIELLKKHGVFIYETAPSVNMMQTTASRIAGVISEVEQATLERAATECEQSEAYRGSMFAQRIRALKPVTDKEEK